MSGFCSFLLADVMFVSFIILLTMYIFTDTSLATIHSMASLRSGLASVILSMVAVSRWRIVTGASSASMFTCQVPEARGSWPSAVHSIDWRRWWTSILWRTELLALTTKRPDRRKERPWLIRPPSTARTWPASVMSSTLKYRAKREEVVVCHLVHVL